MVVKRRNAGKVCKPTSNINGYVTARGKPKGKPKEKPLEEKIFQQEVYRAILEYTSDAAFKKRQRLALIKETYRTMKARQWIHREFIEPRLMSHSEGVLQ